MLSPRRARTCRFGGLLAYVLCIAMHAYSNQLQQQQQQQQLACLCISTLVQTVNCAQLLGEGKPYHNCYD